MLCGCTKPVEPPRATSTSVPVDDLRHRFSDARRLLGPSSPISLRHCFSVRVQPSPGTAVHTRGPAAASEPSQSQESLGLGAEARPRTRSYTLTDGATSAIGRILTCFQDTDASSDDVTRSRPRSRSLWSRRRPPPVSSCLPGSPSGVGAGCVVDVVLDCSPGTVRRRRLETQSLASTSSTLGNPTTVTSQDGDPGNPTTLTSQDSDASSEVTERLFDRQDHPVWERRQIQRGRRRQTEPGLHRPAVVQAANAAPSVDIPPARDGRDIPMTRHDRPRPVTSSKTAGDSAASRRPVTRRAMTCAIPHPQVRVVQRTSSGGGGRPVKTEDQHGHCVKPTTSCRVSCWLGLFISCWNFL